MRPYGTAESDVCASKKATLKTAYLCSLCREYGVLEAAWRQPRLYIELRSCAFGGLQMRLHGNVFAYIVVFGLTACGVTPPDNVVGYTYVSGDSDAALPNAISTPSTTVGNSNITTTAGATVTTTGTGVTSTSGTTTEGGNTTTTGTTTAGGRTTGGTTTNTTTGGTTTGGTTTGGTTTGGTTSTSSTSTYTVDNLSTDMTSVLQAHTPIYSTENLGNPANVALWTPTMLQSLYDGLVATQTFYPNLSMQDLAHLMLALGATDSTGDYRLSNNGAVGYLQVSTSSCQTDYTNHGDTVTGPHGQLISATSITLTTPGANMAIMAWYTRNAVSAQESANEAAAGEHSHPSLRRDVGNAILSWLVGPGSDRWALVSGSDAANRWPAFYNRILDYYVQGGFGTQSSFDAILSTSMPSTLQAFKDAPAGAFP